MINYLPVGTVVLLKNGEKPVVIMGYKVAAVDGQVYKDNQEVESNEIYDYGGVIYPEGIIDTNAICMFYHRDIEKILYMGYVTDDYRDLINVIHENENK